ncbi:MAG TPA: CdaR family protein [Candidatus Binataceae bacterium]
MRLLRQPIQWQEIKKRARRNVGLRLFSVLLAIGLWLYVNVSGGRQLAEPFEVPISYRALPAGFVIMNRPPDFVKVEVSGPKTLLSLLEPEQLTLRLDLKGVVTGQTEIKLSPSMFKIPRRRGLTVTSISPQELTIDVDRIVSREVPVRVDVQGPVARGYTISAVEARPPTVAIIGPSRFLSELTDVPTQTVSVKDATEDVDRSVELSQPPTAAIHLSTTRAEAKVSISEVIANREFRGVDVEVRDTGYKFRLEPRQATITVKGPASKISSLDPTGMVFVDANGDEPGVHEVPVQVNLPDGIQLVRRNPEKARLRLYREKREVSIDGHAS